MQSFSFSPRNGAAFGLWTGWGHCRKSSSIGTWVKTNAGLAFVISLFLFSFSLCVRRFAIPNQILQSLTPSGLGTATTGLTLSAISKVTTATANQFVLAQYLHNSCLEWKYLPGCRGSRKSAWISTPALCGIGSGRYSSIVRASENTSGFPTAEETSLPPVYRRFVAVAEFQALAVDSLATLRSRPGSLLFVHVRPDM